MGITVHGSLDIVVIIYAGITMFLGGGRIYYESIIIQAGIWINFGESNWQKRNGSGLGWIEIIRIRVNSV